MSYAIYKLRISTPPGHFLNGITQTPVQLKNTFNTVSTAILVATALQGCQTGNHITSDLVFPSYVIGSVAKTKLETDTTGFDNLKLDNDSSQGVSLGSGYDLSPALAFELQVSDLGNSTLQPASEVDHLLLSMNALAYGFGVTESGKKRGPAGYLRLGVGILQTDSSSDFRRSESTRYVAGAGLEYTLSPSYSLRAEIVSLNSDVQYFQLGWMYRLSSNTESLDIESAEETRTISDTATTNPPVQHTEQTGRQPLLGLFFPHDSIVLSRFTIMELERIAEEISKNPDQRYYIDSHGQARNNLTKNKYIVKARAQRVANFLIRQGVNPNQIGIRPFGHYRSTSRIAEIFARPLDNSVEISKWN